MHSPRSLRLGSAFWLVLSSHAFAALSTHPAAAPTPGSARPPPSAAAEAAVARPTTGHHGGPTVVPADQALAQLVAGNERYVRATVSTGKPVAAERSATATGQHPIAAIVACADSRTAPEIVFDQSLGDLFVVRTAGNLIDEFGLGSLEYAVEHLGVRLVVVLGHERCGAVAAAVASPAAPGYVGSLVREIRPAVEAVQGAGGDVLAHAIAENASRVAEKIRREARLGPLAAETRVIEAVYDLDTGEIHWIGR